MKAFVGSIMVGAVLCAAPVLASAQLCLGVPAGDGAVAVAARAGVAWDETTYDGGMTANLSGPFSIAGAFAHGMLYPLHRPAKGISGTVAYELSSGGMSVCPVAEAQYERLSRDVYGYAGEFSWMTASLGVNLGRNLASWHEAYLAAHGGSRLIYFRRSYDDHLPETTERYGPTGVKSFLEYGGHAGLTVGYGRVFLDSSVAGTSHGDWKPAYTFSFGFVLGGVGS